MNNTTTSMPIKPNGTGYNPFYRTKAEIIAQTASLAVLGFIIVFGNLASIITFLKSQSLRRRSNYLIISLSAADLLVGVVDFMCVCFFWKGPQWNTFIVVLEVMDTLTGIASTLTLANIAIERFYAIFFPFRHRRLRFRVYVALCAFPWIAATYISALYLTSYVYDRSVLEIYNYHTFSVSSIAIVCILFCYIAIGVKLRVKNNPSAQEQNRSSRDQKLVVTLLLLTLPFILTWPPLQIFLIALYFCKSCKLPHFNVLFLMKFLQFCNSGNNVFIYIVRMPEFRSAFLALFCASEQNMRVHRPNTVNPTNQNLRNSGTGSRSLNVSRNTRLPEVTKDGESSLDKMDNSFGETRSKEPGYQQGVTNHACETEASGNEDSRL